jgi:hypothetical protein
LLKAQEQKKKGQDSASVMINLNDDDPDSPPEILAESIAMAQQLK